MALPLGAYSVNANGFSLTLTISSNTNGNITGTLETDPISGFWDDTAARILFFRMPGNVLSNTQVFFGVQFPDFNIAGTFEGFLGTGASAARTTYAWETLSHP